MRLLWAALLALVAGCASEPLRPPDSKAVVTAEAAAVVIETTAKTAAEKCPAASAELDLIVEQVDLLQRGLEASEADRAKLRKELEVERSKSNRLFKVLLAWAGVSFITATALSVAVALWFRTKAAMFAAVSFGVAAAMCVGFSVAFNVIGWIVIAALGVGAAGFGIWIWRDHHKDPQGSQ